MLGFFIYFCNVPTLLYGTGLGTRVYPTWEFQQQSKNYIVASIEVYIGNLEGLADNLQQKLEVEALAKSGNLLSLVKQRLFNTGIAGDGSSLGSYHSSTIEYKKRKGRRSSFVTLRDEGDWYRGMFIKVENQELLLNSKDWKTPKLIGMYGDRILEFSIEERVAVENWLDAFETKLINDLGSSIDIEI